MQAILTKYLGPSNTRGSRIKAYAECGLSVTVPYPHQASGDRVHFAAVVAFCRRHKGWGPASFYHAGAIKGGYAWVSLPNRPR
jgi:hypothetical protein